MYIEIPVSIAEVFDKISILEIKKNSINNVDKLYNINNELNKLKLVVKENNLDSFFKDNMYKKLYEINLKMWNLCEIRRDYDNKNKFDEEYIEKSRLEYKTNDQRAKLKFEINKYFNSDIIEEKSYESIQS